VRLVDRIMPVECQLQVGPSWPSNRATASTLVNASQVKIAITTRRPRWCAARTACEAARGEIS
jgi:hypothetical protein